MARSMKNVELFRASDFIGIYGRQNLKVIEKHFTYF